MYLYEIISMEAVIARMSRERVIRRDVIPNHGLYPRPTHEELINSFETDPSKIKYPNRNAKFFKKLSSIKLVR